MSLINYFEYFAFEYLLFVSLLRNWEKTGFILIHQNKHYQYNYYFNLAYSWQRQYEFAINIHNGNIVYILLYH